VRGSPITQDESDDIQRLTDYRNTIAHDIQKLTYLAGSGAAETTVRRHFGNGWVLGGEIVRAAQFETTLRKLNGHELLVRFVDQEGGPLLHGHSSDDEQRSFDATCRKLWRFVSATE